MSRRIPKVLLLVALLAAFVASDTAAFGRSTTCRCEPTDLRRLVPPGGCHFNQNTQQCVNVSCKGVCGLV
jgi:hypothetical protein